MKKITLILSLLVFGQVLKAQNWLGFDSLFVPNGIQTLYVRPSDNKLYIAGNFSIKWGAKNIKGIATYDGTNFDSVGCGANVSSCTGVISAMEEFQNNLYVGGQICYMGNLKTQGIAKWNGSKWDSLSPQLNAGGAYALKVFNNELYVGGYFWKIGNMNARSIAKYNGTNWSTVGLGFPYNNCSTLGAITCMEVYNNQLYVGGNFSDSSCNYIGIAKFDGTNWKQVGLTIYGGATEVTDLKVYNGNLYLTGRFKVSDGNIGNAMLKYNGVTWSKVGDAVTDLGTCLMTKMEVINNKLYVVGGFKSIQNTLSAGGVAIWNDTSWCVPPTGPQNYRVSDLAYFQNKLYISGGWYDIGNDTVPILAVLNTSVTTCSAPVGIKENQLAQSNISIYPNPVSNTLHIEIDQNEFENYEIEISNTLGQQVLKLPFSNTVDASKLPQGFYTLKIFNQNKSAYNSKFVKE